MSQTLAPQIEKSPVQRRFISMISRLNELKRLQPGWWEGLGDACNPQQLDWLAEGFMQYLPESLSIPYLYPTESGDILAEWESDTQFVSVEFFFQAKEAELFYLNKQTDKDYSEVFETADLDSFQSIFSTINRILGNEQYAFA